MKARLAVAGAFLLWLSACEALPDKSSTEVALVPDLPSVSSLCSSLNSDGVKVMKWAIHDGHVVYSALSDVDWSAELELLVRSDVNHPRFRDSYTISDTVVGEERTVVFEAKTASQEVQRLKYRIRSGQLVYVLLEKTRHTLLSSTQERLEFRGNTYELWLKQQALGVFETKQFVYGTLCRESSIWRAAFPLNSATLPIHFALTTDRDDGLPGLWIKNGDEEVSFTQFERRGDTLVYGSDFFNAHFSLWFVDDSTIAGEWHNNKRDTPQVMPFTARRNIPWRFRVDALPTVDINGLHTAVFLTPEGEVEDSTILKIEQCQHHVRASFLTETGDYRYLEGVVKSDSLYLSALDGTHAYLFQAAIKDGQMKGVFYAGPSWQQPWQAFANKSFELRNPEAITRLKSDSAFYFSFMEQPGVKRSLDDEMFHEKPVIVSIMGTWCSNCMDEARFLREVYQSHYDRGLRVVALDFELIADSARAWNNIERHRQSLDIPYPILLASLSSTKEKASNALPMLNGIHSYPTMVIMDRQHRVVRIHTGFNGPATGPEHYEAFRKTYLALVDSLTASP